jgi:hypothetical protein
MPMRRDDSLFSSDIVRRLFASVFFLAGAYGLYYGLSLYLQGSSPTTPEVLVPGVVGIVLIISTTRLFFNSSRASITDEEAAQPESGQSENEPWTARPSWRSNDIPETRSSGFLLIFAVIWNVAAWPAAALALYDSIWQPADPQWATLLVLLGPLVGIVVGWLAFKQVLHRWKYGPSTLVMDTMPARLGGPLRGRVQTGVPSDRVPDAGFHVRLSCYHRRVQTHRDADGSTDRDVDRDLKWRDEKRMRADPSPAGSGVAVPILFDIPPALPPSPPHKTDDRILWEVEVSAQMPGLDYDVSFEIPVFEPEEDPTAPVTDPDTVSSEAAPNAPSASSQPGLSSTSHKRYELARPFTEPVTPGIQMESRPEKGLTVSFAPARAKGIASLLTVLGPGMVLGGAFAAATSYLLALLLVAVGALVTYGAWQRWTYASTITVGPEEIELVRGPFGRGPVQRFPRAALEDVALEAQGQAGNTTYYALSLVLDRSAVGPEGHGRLRTWLKQFQKSTAVGTADPAAPSQESTRSVRIAGDLTNNQEADWIATRLLEAAGREVSSQ